MSARDRDGPRGPVGLCRPAITVPINLPPELDLCIIGIVDAGISPGQSTELRDPGARHRRSAGSSSRANSSSRRSPPPMNLSGLCSPLRPSRPPAAPPSCPTAEDIYKLGRTLIDAAQRAQWFRAGHCPQCIRSGTRSHRGLCWQARALTRSHSCSVTATPTRPVLSLCVRSRMPVAGRCAGREWSPSSAARFGSPWLRATKPITTHEPAAVYSAAA